MAQQFEEGPSESFPLPAYVGNIHSSHKGNAMDVVAVKERPGHAPPSKRRNKGNATDQESIGGALRRLVVDHQLGLSLNFILLLGMSHALFPSLRTITKACLSLSYPAEVAGQYGQGPLDFYLVASYVVYFTAARAFMLDYVLLPLAQWCGLTKRKMKLRFAEQAYMLLYYLVYWSWGVMLFVNDTKPNEWTFEGILVSLWAGFPRLLLTPTMKLYYLTQMAFWVQQIVVIHLEERRKDHYQMLAHHFITVGLMVGSYGYRQWRVGNAILVLMDSVDLIFPVAKILRYLGLQTACDCAFGLFVITWIVARHFGYLSICWSVWAHVNEKTMYFGRYSTITGERLSAEGGTNLWASLTQPILRPGAQTVTFNANIRWAFLSLLLGLQALTLAWLVMIIKVVMRVLSGQGADDSRSDDENEEEEEEADLIISTGADLAEKPRFIEVETSSEEVSWPTRSSKPNSGRRKTKGISSGLNLGEHKEILNRIGCLSEEQLAREREKREDSASPRPPNPRRGKN